MSADTLPPPPPPVCLTRSYKSRAIKGGTVIDEKVLDLHDHRQRLLDPDAYRSVIGTCRHCGSKVLHALCYRQRTLRGAGEPSAVVTIRLYRCAERTCGAVFTVLPSIIARNLWRLWKTVEEVSAGKQLAPETTRKRWWHRLRSSALGLVQILQILGERVLPGRFRRLLQKVTSRWSLIEAATSAAVIDGAHSFASLAAWIHRLEAGIRLM